MKNCAMRNYAMKNYSKRNYSKRNYVVKRISTKVSLLKTATLALFFLIVLTKPLFASNITFSGGYTKVSMQENNRSVSLSGGATVTADSLSINAQEIELYGKDYRYVSCTGKVNATDNERGITLQCPGLFYDRETGEIISDGWVEIQDETNDATLSGARFEYDLNSTLIKIQMMAKVVKNTDDGLMICRADSIEFDNESQLVTLKGNAQIIWNGNTYKAAVITVDLNDFGITMEGSISGEVNG